MTWITLAQPFGFTSDVEGVLVLPLRFGSLVFNHIFQGDQIILNVKANFGSPWQNKAPRPRHLYTSYFVWVRFIYLRKPWCAANFFDRQF